MARKPQCSEQTSLGGAPASAIFDGGLAPLVEVPEFFKFEKPAKRVEIALPEGGVSWEGQELHGSIKRQSSGSSGKDGVAREAEFFVLKELVDALEVDEILRVATKTGIGFNEDPDSVDGWPTFETYFITFGKYKDDLASVLQPIVENRLMPWVRRKYAAPDMVACTCLFRRYVADERRVHPVHFDHHAFATAVIALNPSEYVGGLYVQPGNCPKGRRYVPMEKGDVVFHRFDLQHGVKVCAGTRYSLIIWAKDGWESCLMNTNPWYLKDAELGDPDAQFCLAFTYDEGTDGKGAGEDLKEALLWYERSAAQGNAGSLNALGVIYCRGKGVTQDFQRAIKYWELAAAQGYPKAQRNLGLMYESGIYMNSGLGAARRGYQDRYLEQSLADEEKAMFWIRKAAEQGEVDSQYRIAKAYAEGRGLPRDTRRAKSWLRLAADQGHPEATFAMGEWHLRGFLMDKDLASSVRYFKWSAHMGYAKGETNLGSLYAQGLVCDEEAGQMQTTTGVNRNPRPKPDFVRAAELFRSAALKNDPDGQLNLARMYAQGLGGLSRDLAEAMRWCREAADQGSQQAFVLYEELRRAQTAASPCELPENSVLISSVRAEVPPVAEPEVERSTPSPSPRISTSTSMGFAFGPPGPGPGPGPGAGGEHEQYHARCDPVSGCRPVERWSADSALGGLGYALRSSETPIILVGAMPQLSGPNVLAFMRELVQKAGACVADVDFCDWCDIGGPPIQEPWTIADYCKLLASCFGGKESVEDPTGLRSTPVDHPLRMPHHASADDGQQVPNQKIASNQVAKDFVLRSRMVVHGALEKMELRFSDPPRLQTGLSGSTRKPICIFSADWRPPRIVEIGSGGAVSPLVRLRSTMWRRWIAVQSGLRRIRLRAPTKTSPISPLPLADSSTVGGHSSARDVPDPPKPPLFNNTLGDSDDDIDGDDLPPGACICVEEASSSESAIDIFACSLQGTSFPGDGDWWEATLNPGEVLLVPPGWWHQSKDDEPTCSVVAAYLPLDDTAAALAGLHELLLQRTCAVGATEETSKLSPHMEVPKAIAQLRALLRKGRRRAGSAASNQPPSGSNIRQCVSEHPVAASTLMVSEHSAALGSRPTKESDEGVAGVVGPPPLSVSDHFELAD